MSEERKRQTGGKQSKPKTKKIGRPPKPVPADTSEEIIEWISAGKTLREFCRQEGKPAWRTVYDWLEKDESFAARFAHARDLGFDAIAEEALQIADTQHEGVTTKITERGVEETREDMLGHRKLQIETRLKLLAKWNPKKYGDRIGLDHQGGVNISVVTGVPDE